MSSSSSEDLQQHRFNTSQRHECSDSVPCIEHLKMVQLSPSPTLNASPPPDCSRDGNEEEPSFIASSPKMSSTGTIQFTLEVSTTYQGYETYIEDGLICLKHKIRNMEKKKQKLDDYKQRLKLGETLNKDQMGAVTKYEELLHNLAFAREMHKTLDSLTQNLIRAQKKAAKRDQVARLDDERRRLNLVLQIQHLLSNLQQEHIRKDLLAGHNRAPHISAQRLQNLIQLASLLGAKRNKRLSLEEQMGQSALLYLDLLEGKDKPVAGSTFKLMMEELTMLLDCDYFNRLPPPPIKIPEVSLCSTSHTTLFKTNEVAKEEFVNRLYQTDMATPATSNWKAEFQAMKGKEPPDSWDMDFTDKPSSPQPPVCKPWRGAATFIPKVLVANKKQSVTTKRRKERKAKGIQNGKSETYMETPVEVFNSPSALPKDPMLRKKHLEDLMSKIHGSFSFMQDSLLDGENAATNSHPRRVRQSSGSPSPLAQRESTRSPINVLPHVMHSTPLPARHTERKPSLTNGEQSVETRDLKLTVEGLAHEPLQLSKREVFPSPPLYQRESISASLEENCTQTPVSESGKVPPCNGMAPCASTPPQAQDFSTPPTRLTISSTPFQNLHSVFKVNTPLPPNRDLNYEPDTTVFSDMRYTTASTQTPPEFAPAEDELQPVLQSEYTAGSGQNYLSPIQSNGSVGRSGQSHYRGSVRGMARGAKGLAHSFRPSGWHRGGPYMPQLHLRDSGLLYYSNRDPGYQHRRGGLGSARHNSSGWSDSSQVSSPDRDGTFPIVDSGHGDSLSVSTLEIPVTPHGHHPHHATLLPMQLYPLPMRVAFTASRTANFAPGNLDQPIVFDQLHSNLGEMYDAHVGRFTCPANGTYVFIFHILKLAVNVPLYINLMRNEEVMVSAYANDGAPDHETASNHAILPLFQGDQVWLRLHRGAIYGSSWKYSTFSGFLLYQD